MKYPFDIITDFVFVETEINKADVILVPGCSQTCLMEKASSLYNEGYAKYILPSGGPNVKINNYSSEWEMLKDTGKRFGVPENVILKENKARHTFDNAKLSLNVLKNTDIEIKKVIIICKAYHSRRALLTYQTVFPNDTEFYICPVEDSTGITKDNWYLDDKKISIVMGEVVKIGQYFKIEIPKFVKKYSE